MPKTERRRFGKAFKLEAIKRLEAGEGGTALALEFSVRQGRQRNPSHLSLRRG
jgi:transposase-like protein